MEKTIENVLEAFKGYIVSSPFIDVCQTKFGYVILHYCPKSKEIMYTPEIIYTGDGLLQNLREEITLDVISETGHDLEEASQEELEKIEERLSPYLARLS